ncbi:GNAT family N-acetyltransferase [Limimaricola pyoseonensis]|uniref:Protein N-acetyltransferase, RimJ/RimL family n=1 Tax=Limimaricola pyoseonensis TaxID=521013 RepID=A0A1G7CSJ5_9RHOB|nr:GNAT family protein [Limimaricola pyoseonensis]SDE42213.1 Protein N-acetyltransferase, RimJ/RimL family [Limimaricola pyoseonensis]
MSLDQPRAARVTLAPLDPDHLPVLRALRPLPEQEQFSGTAVTILGDDRAGIEVHVILAGGAPVGLFKVDRAYEDGRHFAEAGAWGLRGVMIDARHQGRGIGGAAFGQLPGYLRAAYPDLRRIWLTVNCRNPAARQTYLRGGWIDDGTLYHGGAAGPQHVMRLELA